MEHVEYKVHEKYNQYGRGTVEGLGQTVEEHQVRYNHSLSNAYCPELENIDELILDKVSHDLQLIRVFRWRVELGHIEIFTGVVVMPQYLASPHLVNFEGLYHMFEHCRKHDISRVLFDTF